MTSLSSRPAISIILAVILLGAVGFGAFHYGQRGSMKTLGVQECHRVFDLMDQSLDCGKIEEVSNRVSTLEKRVTTFIEGALGGKDILRVGVFYRDLATRRWFGVNADDEFYPASLAKLPLAVTYYKVADLEPAILDQNLKLEPTELYTNAGQKVSVDSPMEVGQSYAVRRMVEDMLVYSDNRPIGPLISFMREDVWKKVYADLGVRKQSSDGSESWSVSPRAIALIFRSLFNGSYLDPESSQEILGIMTKAWYADALAKGVPRTVRIAHKFGEATMVNNDGSHVPVLHDCGIIYKPESPYILCVMTEGKDFAKLETTIADISKMVYDAQ